MKLGMRYADGVIVGYDGVASELKQYSQGLDVPVLHQHEEGDYLTAVDEFFDTVHAGKSVLVG
jgi:hypothetical protein